MQSRSRHRHWLALGAGLLVLAAGVAVKLDFHNPSAPGRGKPAPSASSPTRPVPQRTNPRPTVPKLPSLGDLPELPQPERPPQSPGAAGNEAWITARTEALENLAWEDDPESMGKILAELRSPLPEIRAAALQATRDFGSLDAVPYLRAIARDTADLQEEKNLNDLIDFLEIPTLLESLDGQPETTQEK